MIIVLDRREMTTQSGEVIGEIRIEVEEKTLKNMLKGLTKEEAIKKLKQMGYSKYLEKLMEELTWLREM
mgnify:CR=1 FL=1